MNEELTREVLEAIKNCDDRKCASCPAKGVCVSGVDIVHIALATALLEERAKPKVWDGAPEWANAGLVHWTNGYDKEASSKLYHRELPKTRARQIAEEIGAALEAPRYTTRIEIIEKLLKKYAEELEGEA
jgi:hypothetical protein